MNMERSVGLKATYLKAIKADRINFMMKRY